MEYERIEKARKKPQLGCGGVGGGVNGGGLSPGKLRNMLVGVERKRFQEEELESTFSLRSQASEVDDSGGYAESCKDVDVVSVLQECSTSTTVDSLVTEMVTDRRVKDHHSLVNSRLGSQDETSVNYDSGIDGLSISSSIFEFQKADRAPQRVPFAPFSKPAPSKWDDAQKWIASPTSHRPKSGGQGVGSRKACNFGYNNRQPCTKVVVEVPDQRLVLYEEPDTKQIHLNQVNLSRHDSSISVHTASTFVPAPSTARSVSMRDMGTEMTPIASQEPSRTGTPVRATTPMRSPSSSQPSTPSRAAPASSSVDPPNGHLDLSEKELQMQTRREIMVLGTQLGKLNIAAWASKEEGDKEASASLKVVGAEQPAKGVIETRAAAWEEAEKAKYMARFKREEMKIQAWENHQKAKMEAEMRKIEVEVERMRGRAHDKLMNKLAAARHKAEERRAAAEAKLDRKAAKTEEQADFIRKTGRLPSSFSFSCCGWCS